jgi:rare lipoprotein A
LRAPAAPVTQTGTASWYGPGFQGKLTASGDVYDQNLLTAAHRTLPLGTRVRVTNLSNGRSVEVRINDRGPFVGDRIIDLSRAAATRLDMNGPGTAEVRVEVLDAPVPIDSIPRAVT